MKTIIAGSRTVTDYRDVANAVHQSGFQITEVVSGGAQGVDKLGEQWARIHSIPIRWFLPDWKGKGKAAGILRNIRMAEYAEALVAVWQRQSRGTAHMISEARARGLKVYVYELP